MTPYDLDFSDTWKRKVIYNSNIYEGVDKIMPWVLDTTGMAAAPTTQVLKREPLIFN